MDFVKGNMPPPDFFLASTEGYSLSIPRACWQIKRLTTIKRDDILLVRIDPPLPGALYGLNRGRDDVVIIAPYFQGTSLFPVSKWPLAVHVGHVFVENAETRDRLEDGEFKSVALGEIYRTEDDARRSTATNLP
jgi:hypothetical protein